VVQRLLAVGVANRSSSKSETHAKNEPRTQGATSLDPLVDGGGVRLRRLALRL
jgi:hypothetical protein